MVDILDKIKEKLIKAKDDLNEKIKAKLKAEMDKRNFSEADATRHIIDRDRGDKMPKPAKAPKPLLQSEREVEVCKTDKNGQWSIEKSNYGPKGMGLYNPADNMRRKANNTGESVADAGKNVNVKKYTTTGSSVGQAASNAEAKRQAKANKTARVKTMKDMTEEEIKAIQDRYSRNPK